MSEESFTRRMLRRASVKKKQDGILNVSTGESPRKFNILQAIENDPFKRNSVQRNSTYVKGFELDNSKSDQSLNQFKTDSEQEKKTGILETNFPWEDAVFNKYTQVTESILETKPLKVEYKHLEPPKKLHAELTTIKVSENNKVSTLGNTVTLSNDLPVTSSGRNDSSSLTEAIRKLDKEIQRLEFENKNTQNIYPILQNLQTDSVYSPRKLYPFAKSPDRNDDESEGRKYAKNDFQTPKSSKSMRPNLESTRKHSISNSTKRSDTQTTISSITMPSPGRENLESNQEYNNNQTVPYEVECFLRDALGDELNNTSVTYTQPDRTDSHINASELISEDRTPIRYRIKEAYKAPVSDEPQHSGTLNRTLTMYRSLTQRIKKKLRPGLKTKEKSAPASSSDILTTFRENEKVQKLLQEIDIQDTLLYQASKALTLCHSMKEFVSSPEQVESERLLLVTDLKKRAVLDEIRKIGKEEVYEEMCAEKGEVILEDIVLPLKESVLRQERQSGDIVEWLVIVVSQGLTVFATKAETCPIDIAQMHFTGCFSIPDLTPTFNITIKIYSLKLKTVSFNHEDKYHIHKKEKHVGCPSPKKLLKKRPEKVISPVQQPSSSISIKDSSFVLSGHLELYLHDLSLVSPWPLMGVPSNSILRGTIDINLSCKLHLSVHHAGFLTYGEESGGLAVWNRRWCVLEGHILKFWNYPREQESKPPLMTIDLVHCVSTEVKQVDRRLCAKPRTLLVETARRKRANDKNSVFLECRQSCTIVRNLLSCDSKHDLSQWTTKLNHIIAALRDWHVINSELPVSDL